MEDEQVKKLRIQWFIHLNAEALTQGGRRQSFLQSLSISMFTLLQRNQFFCLDFNTPEFQLGPQQYQVTQHFPISSLSHFSKQLFWLCTIFQIKYLSLHTLQMTLPPTHKENRPSGEKSLSAAPYIQIYLHMHTFVFLFLMWKSIHSPKANAPSTWSSIYVFHFSNISSLVSLPYSQLMFPLRL